MKYHIELFTSSRAKKHKYFWRIVAANGQTLATSEGYTTKQSRDRTVNNFTEWTGMIVTKLDRP